MKPKILVLSGYGINCERETKYAFDLAGGDAEIVHVNDLISKEKRLSDYQILAFPGGFSYGDDTGSGNAMAYKIRLNLWNELMEFVNSGKLVIGICNGFQILANLGLLPAINKEYGKREAALSFNDSTKYECRWVNLKVSSKKCVFTKGLERLHVPVAHGEGKFFAGESVLDQLEKNDQIVFTYCLPDGSPAKGEFPLNPNGASRDIAGICDETGRILGMMPHPERAILNANSPDFQKEKERLKRIGKEVPEINETMILLFKNAVEYILEAEKKGFTYAKAGVNIEVGDEVSKILYEAAKQTWLNRKGKLGEVIVPFDDFTGVRAIDVSNLPQGTLMNMGFDGVGTKMEIAERLNDHRTIAYDLFAMVCDDAVVRGAEPVLIGSILDVRSLKDEKVNYIEQVRQLADGYVRAAKEANVAIVNGEVAELGSRVGGFGPFNYNWGAGLVWFANKDRMFTGYEIRDGDYLVGLRETGFRSNGLSLLRKVMREVYGEDWHKVRDGELAKRALQPSKIYSGAVVDMFGGVWDKPKAEVHGVAHITGGGVPGKLGRILKPSKLGATIHEPFSPCDLMKHCQEKGNVSDEEAYRTWNMGQGMIIVTPTPDKVIEIARNHLIEAKVIGRVEAKPGIRISSKGFYSPDKYLSFE